MLVRSSIVHATTVALHGRAVLITGPSGSGKSSLALQLLALGAELVADDRTEITWEAGQLIASAPTSISGLIEARGVGILQTSPAGPTPIAFAIDLSRREMDRLPRLHHLTVLDIMLPCLHKSDSHHFPASILVYLRGNRKEPS